MVVTRYISSDLLGGKKYSIPQPIGRELNKAAPDGDWMLNKSATKSARKSSPCAGARSWRRRKPQIQRYAAVVEIMRCSLRKASPGFGAVSSSASLSPKRYCRSDIRLLKCNFARRSSPELGDFNPDLIASKTRRRTGSGNSYSQQESRFHSLQPFRRSPVPSPSDSGQRDPMRHFLSER